MQETKLSVVCEKVLDRCLAPSAAGGEGCDNMTMILVQFKKLAPACTSSEKVQTESKPMPADEKFVLAEEVQTESKLTAAGTSVDEKSMSLQTKLKPAETES